jgi:hypothetical protein
VPHTDSKGEKMFLQRVKRNFKEKYAKPLAIVLLVALCRAYVEIGLGWPPLTYTGCFQIFLAAVVVAGSLAVLKTLWELGIAYYKRLCTFVVAVAKFSRNYWEDKTSVTARVTERREAV